MKLASWEQNLCFQESEVSFQKVREADYENPHRFDIFENDITDKKESMEIFE